jgi:hypothetical protein
MLFIDAAYRALKSDGNLGFIVSNKFLTSNSGIGIRSFLAKNFQVTHLIDLADSKLFQAAVLPLILVARKSLSTGGSFNYALVKEMNALGGVEKSSRVVPSLFRTIEQFHRRDSERNAGIPVSISVRGFKKTVQVEAYPAALTTLSHAPSLSRTPLHDPRTSIGSPT